MINHITLNEYKKRYIEQKDHKKEKEHIFLLVIVILKVVAKL